MCDPYIGPRSDPDIAHMEYSMDPPKYIYRPLFSTMDLLEKYCLIDSFPLDGPVSTLQSLQLTELSDILCIMTYYHSIPKGI